MGPILFCMLMDSLQTIDTNSKMVIYADDVTILHHVAPTSSDNSQMEVDHVCRWANTHRMFINENKCAILNVHRSVNALDIPDIIIGGIHLKPVDSMKILGFHFDHRLDLRLHVNYIVKKCSFGMSLVHKLKKLGSPSTVIESAFYAFVFSQMSYAWPAIVDMPQYLVNRYQKFFDRVSKFSNIKRDDLKKKLEKICLKLCKKIKKTVDHPLIECFQRNPSIRSNLRTIHNYIPLKSNTNLLRNSFTKYAYNC